MKVCKIKPSSTYWDTCRQCLDVWETTGVTTDCSKCYLKNSLEGEILSYGSSFWSGDYAMVQINGKIEKIALSRIYDVRDV